MNEVRELIQKAITRAKVFDDGSDGADAESAQSTVRILEQALEKLPVEPVTWFNGCDRNVPAALRYLAENPRPMYGCAYYNTEHLYQLADEIDRMVATPLYSEKEER